MAGMVGRSVGGMRKMSAVMRMVGGWMYEKDVGLCFAWDVNVLSPGSFFTG